MATKSLVIFVPSSSPYSEIIACTKSHAVDESFILGIETKSLYSGFVKSFIDSGILRFFSSSTIGFTNNEPVFPKIGALYFVLSLKGFVSNVKSVNILFFS